MSRSTPGGSVPRIVSSRSRAAVTTRRLFSPRTIITIPVTTSPRPSRVAAPCRARGAIVTLPTSRMSTGTPPGGLRTTTFSMSSTLRSSACPRMNRCSPLLTV